MESKTIPKSLIEVFQCFAPVHCYSNKPNISNSIDGSLHYGHQLLWHIDYSLGGLKKIESRIWNYLCVDSHIDRCHVKFEGPRWLGSASSGPPSPHIWRWSDTSPCKGVSFFLMPSHSHRDLCKILMMVQINFWSNSVPFKKKNIVLAQKLTKLDHFEINYVTFNFFMVNTVIQNAS